MYKLLAGVFYLLLLSVVTFGQVPETPLALCTTALLDFRDTAEQVIIDRQPDVIRHRFSRLADWDTAPDLLQFNCFADATFVGQRIRMEQHINGTQSIVYELLNQVMGYAIVSMQDGFLFVKIQDEEGRVFTITPETTLAYAIAERSSPAIDEGLICQNFSLQSTSNSEGVPAIGIPSSVCASTTAVCDVETVDVLLVYTPDVRHAYGTVITAENALATAITESNQVLVNSGVIHRFAVAHIHEVDYVENGILIETIYDLFQDNDGQMDDIHLLRNLYEADLVAMIVAEGDGCGIGNVNTNENSFDSQRAYSVTLASCMTSNLSLAHELGHNLGLQHDWYVNDATKPCTFAHGYVNNVTSTDARERQWRTVMAYADRCVDNNYACRRVPYFSNPDVQHSGDPTGVSRAEQQPSDAAFVLNRSMCKVAQFKENTANQPNLTTRTQSVVMSIEQQVIQLATTIENRGFVSSTATHIVFYLSDDPIISPDDLPIGHRRLPRLDANDSMRYHFRFDATYLEILEGRYYVGYLIDHPDMVEENTETDNAYFVTAPRLEVGLLNTPLSQTNISFAVRQQDHELAFSWEVDTRHTIEQFVIQESDTGKDWINIGNVIVDTNRQLYEWQYQPPLKEFARNENRYYRLQWICEDATQHYSEVRPILWSFPPDRWLLYPNPAHTTLTLHTPTFAWKQLRLSDSYGRLVYEMDCNTACKYHEIAVENWATGIYLLYMIDENGDAHSRRVVVHQR